MGSFYDSNYMGKDGLHYGLFFSPEAVAAGKLFYPKKDKIEVGHTNNRKEKKIKRETETIYRHILATPIVDVLSITIGGNCLDNHEMREIYGHIRVIDSRHSGDGGDADGEIACLFRKDKDNPLSIKLGEHLPLTHSLSALVVPSKDIILDVLLYDKHANNVVVAQGKLVLDNGNGECVKHHVREVYGEVDWIFAHVEYTAYQYAVTATIDVLYFSKDDNFDRLADNCGGGTDGVNHDNQYIEESSDKIDLIVYDRDYKDCGEGGVADICGRITVRSNVDNGCDEDYLPISVFRKSPKEGVQVKSGSFLQLSRSVVAVPAYSSSLVIDVDLSHCDTMKPVACGVLKFKPRHEDTFKDDLVGEHGRIRVRVTWDNGYDQHHYRASEKNQKRQMPKLNEEDYFGPVERPEVFSVAVYNKNFKPFSFYGKIDVKDWLTFYMFSKDKSCPQVCPDSGALATLNSTYSRSLSAEHFAIHVDLRDATTDDQISNGYASWDTRIIWPWRDRRLCSVIRGERGFTAVHYTIFFDGISAIVDVKLYGKLLPGYVYGNIVARYGSYEYSTAYDNKFYQIILFNRSLDDVLQPMQTCGSTLLLLKRFVCLPIDSSLIVEANLSVCSEPPFDGKLPQAARAFHGIAEFKPDADPVQRMGDESCYMEVCVTRRYDLF